MTLSIVLPFCKDVAPAQHLPHCVVFGFVIRNACMFHTLVPFLLLLNAFIPTVQLWTPKQSWRNLDFMRCCTIPPPTWLLWIWEILFRSHHRNLNCGDFEHVLHVTLMVTLMVTCPKLRTAQLPAPSCSFILLDRRPFAERGLCPIKEPMVSRLKRLCWNLLWESCLCYHLGKKVSLCFQLGVEGSCERGFIGSWVPPMFSQALTELHSSSRLCVAPKGPARQPEGSIANLIP